MFVYIIDKKVKELRDKQISLIKVIWNEVFGNTAWKLEKKIGRIYPYLFNQ